MFKCFDSIYRNALWLKMYKSGIQGKLLRIIRDMYNKVKSCVKSCNTYSDFFEYAVGLRQGEVISPILFSFFVNDLELYLQNEPTSGLLFYDIVLMLLLFADDMAIFAKSPDELQTNINLLHSYCKTWGLTVNTDKTKIMVFRKRGRLLSNEKWNFDGKELTVVDDFNYLGTVFNYTGSFKLNQEYLAGKAIKALNVLLQHFKKYDLKPKILCQLFDSFVGSILKYSAQVWGFTQSKEQERIHLKFCKRILKLKANTSNAGVYGELGRYPLFITRYIQIIKYWSKIIHTDNIIIEKVYEQAKTDCNAGLKNWVYNVKLLLSNHGFSYIFEDAENVDFKSFICIFKQRITDNFIQEWSQSMQTNHVLTTYVLFKNNLHYESYLDLLPSSLRMFFCRLRLSVHPLRIQTGRYGRNRIARDQRYCLFCNSHDIEDEYHFMLICPFLEEIRKKYVPKYYYQRPSMFKFLEMLGIDNKTKLIKISLFIKYALNKRNSLLNVSSSS